MNRQTEKLLKECNSGCKMALQSMKQVEEYLDDSKLEKLIHDYRKKHEQIEEKTSLLLAAEACEEKEPGAMASISSWITTEMRLLMKKDSHQVAKLMMNGCNMGIQGIAKCQNECKEADAEAKAIARELVKIEEELMSEMKQFI